jgi:hypothetical protein
MEYSNSVVAEEPQDKINSHDKLHLSKSKPRPTTTTNPRRSRRIQSASVEPEETVHHIDPAVPDLPKKIKVAKAKARATPHKPKVRDIYNVPEDDDNSAAIFQRPMTPARNLHLPTGSHIYEQNIAARAQIQKDIESLPPAPTADPEEDGEPKELSKKALGKRKASDSVVVTESSKKRKRKDKAPDGTPQLHQFGFNSEGSSSSAKGRSHSVLHPSQKDLASTVRRLYAEAENGSISSPLEAVRSTTPNEIIPQQQVLTQWTPINPKDQAKISIEPTKPTPEKQYPEVIIPSSVPKSSERRKRRLPTGEAESSTVKVDKSPTKKSISKPKSNERTSQPRVSTGAKGSRIPQEQFETISDIVETWRVENDLSEYEMNDFIQQTIDAKSKPFWDHLCEEIDVPRLKLQQFCRRKFHNFERGPFTEQEDADLRRLHEQNPGKWKQIGQTLNRFPDDCRDRWRNYLICGENLKRESWRKEEEDALRTAVEECIQAIKEGRRTAGQEQDASADDEALVDWQTVSQKMGRTRSRLQCQTKWKSIKERMESNAPDAVAKAPVSSSMWRFEQAEKGARAMKPVEKLALLYAIRDSGAGSEGKIPWVLIQRDDLHVHKQRMKLKICYRALKRMVPDYESLKLQEIVEYLIDAYEAAAPVEPKGFKKAFYTTQLRAVSSTPSETPKGQKRVWPLDSDPEDNSEIARPTKAKKSRTKSKGKKAAMTEKVGNENVPSSTPKPKKRKTLRERMKPLTEQISQETNGEPEFTSVAEDFTSSFNTIKTGRARTSLRGNKSASTSKSKSLFLSKEYVSESEDAQDEAQESAAIQGSQPEKEKEIEGDDQQSMANANEGFTVRGGVVEDDVSVDEDEAEDDNSHETTDQESATSAEEDFTTHGRLIKDDISVDEEEDESQSHDDKLESVGRVDEEFTARGGPIIDDPSANDEDEERTPIHTRATFNSDIEDDPDEHNITLNGFHTVNERGTEYDESEDESEEEEFRGRSPSKRPVTPFAHKNDKTPKDNRYTNGVSNARESSVVSDSSMGSMGDIPAIPRRSQVQREVSAEL